jgi:hypothetical protein
MSQAFGRIQNGSAPLPTSTGGAAAAAAISGGALGDRGDRRDVTIRLRLECIRNQRIERCLRPVQKFSGAVGE